MVPGVLAESVIFMEQGQPVNMTLGGLIISVDQEESF